MGLGSDNLTRIEFIKNDKCINVNKRDKKDLQNLRNKIKNKLRNTSYMINLRTNFVATINNRNIGKLLHPAPNFNPYDKNYLNNLNALFEIEQLFKIAVYITSLKPMKGKENKKSLKKYHHFVAPLIMNGKKYKVLLTALEKSASKVLFINSLDVCKINFYLDSIFYINSISLKQLIKNVKIYNYDDEDFIEYNLDDIISKNDFIKEESEVFLLS